MFLALTMVAAMSAHPSVHVSASPHTTSHHVATASNAEHTTTHTFQEEAVTRQGISEEETLGKSPSPVYSTVPRMYHSTPSVPCDKAPDPSNCPDNMLPESRLQEEDDVHSHPFVWFVVTIVLIAIVIRIGRP